MLKYFQERWEVYQFIASYKFKISLKQIKIFH